MLLHLHTHIHPKHNSKVKNMTQLVLYRIVEEEDEEKVAQVRGGGGKTLRGRVYGRGSGGVGGKDSGSDERWREGGSYARGSERGG